MDIINPPQLSEIVNFIRNNTGVECIICYGQRFKNELTEGCFLRGFNENQTYVFDLLIVVSDSETRNFNEIAEVIANGNTWENITLTTVLVKASVLNDQLKNGNFFFNNVVYSGYELFYTEHRYYVDELVFEQVWLKWKQAIEKEKESAFKRSHDSLRTAEEMLREDNHNKLILPVLRQSIRFACTSIITWLLGHDESTSDIDGLISIINTISTKPGLVFPRNTAEEQKLFLLLKEFHLNTPGRETYKLDTRRLLILHARTRDFVSVCEDVFNDYIKSIP